MIHAIDGKFVCRFYLYGFNYTMSDWSNAIWQIGLDKHLGADDVNITSRLTMFTDPVNTKSKVRTGYAGVCNQWCTSIYV